MFNKKRRYLVVEETDVTTLLQVINRHRGFFSSNEMRTGNCGWAKEPTKWFVDFDASDKEWGRIAGELSKSGKIYVNVTPAGTTDLYYMREES